jgi:Holliday junction resolvase RusA-like endonuclease
VMRFVNIKPLSVNLCWRGKRFKTPAYSKYEIDLLFMLPKITVPKNKQLSISLEFGVSNMASDFDNPVKPFVDVLQKKYGFNDKLIMKASITKVLVQKGCEYVGFSITEF